MDEKQLPSMWENPEGTLEALQNEAACQLSVLSVIGDELEGACYGAQLAAPHTPRSLQGLRSVLDVHYDDATVDRLLATGGALRQTPRGNAVGWTSFRNYTLETVGQTFMHETGHLLNAIHSATVTSQRCRVLGIFPVGVTGPSTIGGASDRNLRTNCFAVTQPTAGLPQHAWSTISMW